MQAYAVRQEDIPRLMRWCEAAARRRAARRLDGEPFVWGPSYAGYSAASLAGLGGEVARLQSEDDRGKRCGCDDAEVCEFCAPPQLLRRWAAGCSCSGSEVCIDCVDRTLLQEAPDWRDEPQGQSSSRKTPASQGASIRIGRIRGREKAI